MNIEGSIIIGIAALGVGISSRWLGNLLADKKDSITNTLSIKENRKDIDKLEKRIDELEREFRHRD